MVDYSNYLIAYAEEAKCLAINTDDNSEFARVWITCFTYGIAIACAYCIPYFLGGYGSRLGAGRSGTLEFGEPKDEEEEAGDAEGEEPGVERGGREPQAEEGVEDAAGGEVKEMHTTKASWFDPESDDPTPNIAAAREHLRRSSPTDMNFRWRGVWSTSLVQIGQIGGAGLELYFRLLRSLGIAFLFMSVLTTPIWVFSFYGNFAPDTGSVLAKTTVGNLGHVAQAGLPQEERWILVGCQGLDIRLYTPIFGYLDVMATVIFLVTLVQFRFKTIPSLKKEQQQDTLSVADFSLLIDCLPPKIDDHAKYEAKLKEHIEERLRAFRETCKKDWKQGKGAAQLKAPKVHEIALTRDYDGRLSQVKSRAQLMLKKDIEEYKGNTQKVEQLDAKIKKRTAFLDKKLPPEEELPVVRAYAILDTPFDAHGMLTQYRFSRYRFTRCCMSSAKRFEGKAIRIRRPTEPSALIAENQDLPTSERRYRKFVMLSMSLAAACLSFFLIATTNWAKGTDDAAAGSILSSGACDAAANYARDVSEVPTCDYLNATQWTEDEVAVMGSDAISCYCLTKGYTLVIGDASLSSGVCKDWLIDAGKTLAVNFGAALVIVFLNTFFRLVITYFAASEKPLTISQLERSKMTRIFFSQFMNTSMVILILNYQFMVPGVDITLGYYNDSERGWYTVVGGTIVSNMLLNAGLSATVNFFMTIVKNFIRCCRASSKKHQVELLQLYTHPKFDISARFAQLLMTVWVTLLFNSGMPVVTPCACAYCFLTYWSDKKVLLHGSSRPPTYDTQMPSEAAMLMLTAVPLHLLFAIVMYSHQCTFPSNPLGGTLGNLADQGIAAANTAAANATEVADYSGLFDRATRESTWLHSLLLFVTFVMLVVYLVLAMGGATFGEGIRFIVVACCPARAPKIAPADVGEDAQLDKVSWTDAEPALALTQPPTSYKLENSLGFEKIATYLNKGMGAMDDKMDPEAGPVQEAPEHTAVTPMTPVNKGAKESLAATPDSAL